MSDGVIFKDELWVRMRGSFVFSIVMPVCPYPDPSDPNGDPHPFLAAALDSVVAGLGTLPQSMVELWIGTDGPCPKVTDFIYEWMARNPDLLTSIFQSEKQPVCTWGNRQRNDVLHSRWMAGKAIVWQDQDDRFCPGALEQIARLLVDHPGQPIIAKMQVCADRNGSPPFVLWKEKGRIERNHIGGHMLIAPNEPSLLGRWEPETSYAADFDFIDSTLKNFAAAGKEPVWTETFISMLRPHALGI